MEQAEPRGCRAGGDGPRRARRRRGQGLPRPRPTSARIRFFAAGFPDYPWLFATDGEYTAFPAVAVGRFEVVRDHLRALRDVSRAANRGSGKIVHEVVTDGSVYFGTNADKGNTDESVKFASAVALLWRWSGRADWLKDLYPDARAAVGYVTTKLDADGDLWPEGSGNVEREGMGEEKLDNAVYLYRALVDLAAMARAVGDKPTAAFAASRAAKMKLRFGRAWFMPSVPGFADSLDDPGDQKLMQRHWIGATPMESEPAPATRAQAIPSLAAARDEVLHGRLGPVPHGHAGLRPRGVLREVRAAGVLAQHGDHGRCRSQLRAPRGEPPLSALERPTRRAGPTSSRARCRRSPRPTTTAARSTRRGTSVLPCSRPGARTGPCGPSCTTSSASRPTSAGGGCG